VVSAPGASVLPVASCCRDTGGLVGVRPGWCLAGPSQLCRPRGAVPFRAENHPQDPRRVMRQHSGPPTPAPPDTGFFCRLEDWQPAEVTPRAAPTPYRGGSIVPADVDHQETAHRSPAPEPAADVGEFKVFQPSRRVTTPTRHALRSAPRVRVAYARPRERRSTRRRKTAASRSSGSDDLPPAEPAAPAVASAPEGRRP
jgi:hypothetical protein